MPGLKPEIIEENEDFWLLNKPIGWTVQRDDQAPSVLAWLLDTFDQKGLPVHRLDKPTSGLLIVAKTNAANRQLSLNFLNRKVEKTYLAISDQKPKKKQGWVKGDMAQSRRSQWKLMRTTENPAITQFESELLVPGVRGFILKPKTGKTHQLRVAMKSIGSPILGDALYGGNEHPRLLLHAWRLAFEFKGTDYRFEALPTQSWDYDWPKP